MPGLKIQITVIDISACAIDDATMRDAKVLGRYSALLAPRAGDALTFRGGTYEVHSAEHTSDLPHEIVLRVLQHRSK